MLNEETVIIHKIQMLGGLQPYDGVETGRAPTAIELFKVQTFDPMFPV